MKPGSEELTTAVARYLFKLMAYKDEYEVARLFTDTGFKRAVAERFTGDYVIKHHMAPPIFSRRDPETGHLIKKEFWSLDDERARGLGKVQNLCAAPHLIHSDILMNVRQERALIGEYEGTIEELLSKLTSENLDVAAEIAGLPEFLRGYGHVKERHLEEVKERESELLEAFRSGRKAPAKMAAE